MAIARVQSLNCSRMSDSINEIAQEICPLGQMNAPEIMEFESAICSYFMACAKMQQPKFDSLAFVKAVRYCLSSYDSEKHPGVAFLSFLGSILVQRRVFDSLDEVSGSPRLPARIKQFYDVKRRAEELGFNTDRLTVQEVGVICDELQLTPELFYRAMNDGSVWSPASLQALTSDGEDQGNYYDIIGDPKANEAFDFEDEEFVAKLRAIDIFLYIGIHGKKSKQRMFRRINTNYVAVAKWELHEFDEHTDSDYDSYRRTSGYAPCDVTIVNYCLHLAKGVLEDAEVRSKASFSQTYRREYNALAEEYLVAHRDGSLGALRRRG